MKVFLGLAIVAMTLIPSFASASSFTYSETVSVAGTTPARMTAREFTFYAYPGQQIEASVVFTSTAGDVDLQLIAPGGSCSLPPLDVITAADCVIYTTSNRLTDPLCTNPASQHPINVATSGSDSESATVARGGPWRAVVLFPTGVLQTRYTLTLAVDGQDPGVSGPVASSFLIGNPVCRLP